MVKSGENSSISIDKKKRVKVEKAYQKAFFKRAEILHRFNKKELAQLHKTDNATYQSYRRCVKAIETHESSGFLSENFLESVRQKTHRMITRSQSKRANASAEDNNENHDRDYMFDEDETTEEEDDGSEYNDEMFGETAGREDEENTSQQFCKNCLRKHSQYLVDTYGDIYNLHLTNWSYNQISKRTKFRNINADNTTRQERFLLCQECSNYLNKNINDKFARSSKNVWPSFVYATLTNEKVLEIYGNRVWRLVPIQWRHWWIDMLPPIYNVTIQDPPAIFVDRTGENKEWDDAMCTMALPDIDRVCDKYMIPKVLCPYGCSEFNFHAGHFSLDLTFQQYLPKVNIDLIEDIGKMRFIRYARDDYIRFESDYDCWLLNSNWKVVPSVCYVKEKGMQIMLCKDHKNGSPHLFVHPPRQPDHILPCKYSDQICHAVIKPRTISQMKAHKYSNTYQMHEQRGNFNGIDTCSVTQSRNFKLLSHLLQENESRSLRGRPDINALLNQFVKEKIIPAEFAEAYHKTAREQTRNLDIDDLSSGATYVTVKAATRMQNWDDYVSVIWDGLPGEEGDMEENICGNEQYIKPQFPAVLYPLQKCNNYGATPYTIPTYHDRHTNTSMLWLLSGILTQVEEVWNLISNVELRQSRWHGWLLTYITKKCFTHLKNRPSKVDPFKITFMRKVSDLMEKIEYVFDDSSFSDVFVDFESIYVLGQDDDIHNVNYEDHECIVIENVDNSDGSVFFEEILELEEGQKYELRAVMTLLHESAVKYNSSIYSRHGGCYSEWWFQERIGKKVSLPVQVDGIPNSFEHDEYLTAVYVRCKDKDMEDISKKLMEYIGGQTHVVCSKHKLPLIPVPDRKATCSCGRKEHYRCPVLDCYECICDKCAANNNTSETVHRKASESVHRNASESVHRNASRNRSSSSDSSMSRSSGDWYLQSPHRLSDESSEKSSSSDSDLQTPHPLSDESSEKSSSSDSSMRSSSSDSDLETPHPPYEELIYSDYNEGSFSENESSESDDSSVKSRRDGVLERDDFDDFITHGIPDALDSDSNSDDSERYDYSGDFYIPTTDAGDVPFEIEKNDDLEQTRGVNISGHVLLNFVGTLLTRKHHQLKASSIHKYFLQRIVALTIGESVPLLYPEGMLFACIFWLMKEGALVGAIPATLLTEDLKHFGFAPLPEQIRSRLTASGFQTGTNERYISWLYDIIVNLATNKHDTRMVVNKGLTASPGESSGLNLRGGNNDSPLLDSVDSDQMIKSLMAMQKYYPFDFFVSYTDNQSEHFGTRPIKRWIDGHEWKKNFPGYDNLTASEKEEIKKALDQASSGLLLRAWNETCRVFLDYLKKSPSSPFIKVSSIFSRHEFQSNKGNLPHIHAMIKIAWHLLTEEEKVKVRDLIRASHLDIVKVDEIPRLIEEGLIKDASQVRSISELGRKILSHLVCSPSCLVMVAEDKEVCRKPNYLLKNPAPNNTRETYEILPNSLSIEALRQLEKVGIIEPLEYDEVRDYLKPFKSRLPYFHPKRHIPPVNWNEYCNISPVEGYTFSYCKSMQNIQLITDSGGCNKYTIKYVGKIDAQNYVIVYSDGHKNGHLILKSTYLHNTKLSASKYNEDKKLNAKREKSHARGRAISLMEQLHSMLLYSEVATDCSFEKIPTVPLEIRQSKKVASMRENNNNNNNENATVEDGAEVGNVCENAREQLFLPEWRHFTHHQLLILQESQKDGSSYMDKITEFSVRPPELCSCFDKVGNYYRWFKIEKASKTKEKILDMLSHDEIISDSWIDGQGRVVKLRYKAIREVIQWLDAVVQNDSDYNNAENGKMIIRELFHTIDAMMSENRHNEINHLLYDDSSEEHLPIPVYSYVRPDMGAQFLLHILLSLGRYRTEMDLIHHPTLRDSFRYAKLIGSENDEESLKEYSDELFVLFVEEQMIFMSQSRSIIDDWILISADLFNRAIIENVIPITEMPSVQLTSLMRETDEKCEKYIEDIKKEILGSALRELNDSRDLCNIPSEEELLEATKQDPLDWNASETLQQSANQSNSSFDEQKQAITYCTNAIDDYSNILRTHMVKSWTLRGFAGCGKSWSLQYCLLYCYAKGLLGVTTSVMSKRSVFLGSKHIDHLFSLPFSKRNMSPYQMSNDAFSRLQRYPEKLNLLRSLDVLFIDEIGQLPAEVLSAIEITLRRVRDSKVFMGGVLIISTMDHTQLQPVQGKPFLLSTHVITSFRMVKLEKSVRANGDLPFQRLQQIISMHYSVFQQNPALLDELRNLLQTVPTYVDTWESQEITSDTYRLYGRKTPANEATRSFLNSQRTRLSSTPGQLFERSSIDEQRLKLSHGEWTNATVEISAKLDKKVKEPSTLLFFRGAVFEFTHNLEGVYSQSQMALLYDLPTQDDLDRWKKIKILRAPSGLHDIEFNETLQKEDYIQMGFVEIEVGVAPVRSHGIGRVIQAQRKQYALKHRVTSTIHAAMGDTLIKVCLQLIGAMFELWDKAQLIVAFTRTKLGKNIFLVGNKEETIENIVRLVQSRSQWTDYMESVLNLVTVGNNNGTHIPVLNLNASPFRVCDTPLPSDSSGYVYFLISVRTMDYSYIGMTNSLVKRLKRHNSGYGSTSTTPAHRRPYAVLGYICGFDCSNVPLRSLIEQRWKQKRDFLISQGVTDPKEWCRAGRIVINDLDDNLYRKEKPGLRFIELFKD